MKKLGMLAIIVLSAVMASCTAMPPEAVQLSQSLGQMMSKAETAHINVINQYFDAQAVKVDQFALGPYKQAELANTRKLAKEKDATFVDLTTSQYDALMTRVMTHRLDWLRAVEVDRQTLLRETADYYALMSKVNNEVTNVVRSAAGVDSAKDALIKDLTTQFGQRAKEIEDKLLGTNSRVEQMLNDAIKKVFGD